MSANKKDKQNEEAARHLFLWAVLFNQKELAELIWRHTSDHIGMLQGFQFIVLGKCLSISLQFCMVI